MWLRLALMLNLLKIIKNHTTSNSTVDTQQTNSCNCLDSCSTYPLVVHTVSISLIDKASTASSSGKSSPLWRNDSICWASWESGWVSKIFRTLSPTDTRTVPYSLLNRSQTKKNILFLFDFRSRDHDGGSIFCRNWQWNRHQDSYLCRIKRKNSSCCSCRHHLQDITHLLLDCLASELLRRTIFGTTSSIFDLWSRSWGVTRLLGRRGVSPRPQPSEGVR